MLLSEYNSRLYTSQSSQRSPSRSVERALTPRLKFPCREEDQPFQVFVRVRPLNEAEAFKRRSEGIMNILKIQENRILIDDPDTIVNSNGKMQKKFDFSDVFDESCSNHDIFSRTIKNYLSHVFNGYNLTLFVYGMTGTGKTFTLFGNKEETSTQDLMNVGTKGILLFTTDSLFEKIKSPEYRDYEIKIKISYVEIYNEQVRDLISSASQHLMIVEDPVKGIILNDVTELEVCNADQVNHVIAQGNNKRTKASTSQNLISSRSHAIIQLNIDVRRKNIDQDNRVYQSKLMLIDLAGSEKSTMIDNKGLRFIEGASINRSLLSLGNCIKILSDPNKRGAFVPYRDSKLTRMLKDSLGGNTKTIMIACISPLFSHYEETINTLKYASRARCIKKSVTKNVKEIEIHASNYKAIIEELRGEIKILKAQIAEKSVNPDITISSQILVDSQSRIEAKNHEIEEISTKILENLEKNWEMTQAIMELQDLEESNLKKLKKLYEAKEKSDEEDKLETIQKKIQSLKQTMSNNEKIKKDIDYHLKENTKESEMLKKKLMSFENNGEDFALAKKIINIDKKDLITQNFEIKKEALNLVKDKMVKNMQLAEMQKELRFVKMKLQEKEDEIVANTQIINELKNKYERNSLQGSEEFDSKIIKTANTTSVSRSIERSSSNKSSLLRDLLANLENKISKSLIEMDEKLGSNTKLISKAEETITEDNSKLNEDIVKQALGESKEKSYSNTILEEKDSLMEAIEKDLSYKKVDSPNTLVLKNSHNYSDSLNRPKLKSSFSSRIQPQCIIIEEVETAPTVNVAKRDKSYDKENNILGTINEEANEERISFPKKIEFQNPQNFTKQQEKPSKKVPSSVQILEKNYESIANLVERVQENVSEKKNIEFRSLGQEREQLKIFRNKISMLAHIDYSSLNPSLAKEVNNLLTEHSQKKYVLSSKDQEIITKLKNLMQRYHERESKRSSLVQSENSNSSTKIQLELIKSREDRSTSAKSRIKSRAFPASPSPGVSNKKLNSVSPVHSLAKKRVLEQNYNIENQSKIYYSMEKTSVITPRNLKKKYTDENHDAYGSVQKPNVSAQRSTKDAMKSIFTNFQDKVSLYKNNI